MLMFFLIVVVMMMLVFFLIVVVMMMLVLFLIVVVMMMLVLFLIVVVMMMLVLFFIVIVMVMMLMLFFIVIVMMVELLMLFSLFFHFFGKSLKFGFKSVLVLHCLEYKFSVQFIPWCGDYGSICIMGPQKIDDLLDLVFAHIGSPAEDYAVCELDLVVEELAEVLHIHLCLLGVDYGGETVQVNLLISEPLYCKDDIAQFSDSGWLYEYPVRMELGYDLFKGYPEISDETAADAP